MKFGSVGAVGFGVEAALLALLVYPLGWGPIEARAVSFPVALAATFLLNRCWTFPAGLRFSLLASFGAYTAIQAIGAGINLLAYIVLIKTSQFFAQAPIVALTLGATIALAFNFVYASRLVFKP